MSELQARIPLHVENPDWVPLPAEKGLLLLDGFDEVWLHRDRFANWFKYLKDLGHRVIISSTEADLPERLGFHDCKVWTLVPGTEELKEMLSRFWPNNEEIQAQIWQQAQGFSAPLTPFWLGLLCLCQKAEKIPLPLSPTVLMRSFSEMHEKQGHSLFTHPLFQAWFCALSIHENMTPEERDWFISDKCPVWHTEMEKWGWTPTPPSSWEERWACLQQSHLLSLSEQEELCWHPQSHWFGQTQAVKQIPEYPWMFLHEVRWQPVLIFLIGLDLERSQDTQLSFENTLCSRILKGELTEIHQVLKPWHFNSKTALMGLNMALVPPEWIGNLISALNDDPWEGWRLLEELPLPQGRTHFEHLLFKATEDVQRLRAINALALLPFEQNLDSLLHTLFQDKDPDVRIHAILALEQFPFEQIREPLLQAMHEDKDREVQFFAARTLVQKGSDQPLDFLLRTLLENTQSEDRSEALHALAMIHSDQVYPALVKALEQDPVFYVRSAAAEALRFLPGPNTHSLLHQTFEHEENASVKWALAFALGKLKNPASLQPFLSALQHENPDTRSAAIFALTLLEAKAAIPEMILLLQTEPDPQVRAYFVAALGDLQAETAGPYLAKLLLQDPDAGVRKRATQALGSLAHIQASTALIRALLTDTDAKVRCEAIESLSALAQVGYLHAHPPLIQALLTDVDPEVKTAAAFALAHLGVKLGILPLLDHLTASTKHSLSSHHWDYLLRQWIRSQALYLVPTQQVPPPTLPDF
ncbi:MAG: HEAT repeat domain-containing protein [Candidatus Sericytochromatia bacterium]